MPSHPTAPALLPVGPLLAQLQALTLLGIDVQRVKAQIGELPQSPDAMVPVQHYATMWVAASDQYGRPGLPSALGLAIPFGAFGAIDYLTGSADNVGGAIESLVLHFAMLQSDTVFMHEQLADGAHVVHVRPVAGTLPSVALEFTLAVLMGRLRYLTASAFPLVCVGLPVPRPANDPVRVQLWAAPLVYDYPGAMLQFAPAAWSWPTVRSDPYLHAALTHMAGQLQLSQPGDSDLERALRVRLRDALPLQDADSERMAQLLGMSERTLQRRLSELGRTYTAVVEDFRHDEALLLLANGQLALVRVASQLGYSEQTSFTRAFRRWTGTTPGSWRMERGL